MPSSLTRFWLWFLSLFGYKRKRLTLVFDLDSVLNQLHNAWIELIKLRLGDEIKYEDCTRWDYPMGQKKYLDLLPNEPGFFQTIPEMEGAIEAVNHLHQLGYEIIICSASHPKTILDKQIWLLERFPWLRYKDIIYATRKELLAREDRLLIDDGHHNYDAWVREGGHAVIVDHPWNHSNNHGHPSKAPRIQRMSDLVPYVLKLEAKRGSSGGVAFV